MLVSCSLCPFLRTELIISGCSSGYGRSYECHRALMYRYRRRCVTGLPVCADGIDNFCLFYDAKTKKVGGINGSGRAPKALNLEFLRKQGITGDSVCSQ
jgi:hypothetical protein